MLGIPLVAVLRISCSIAFSGFDSSLWRVLDLNVAIGINGMQIKSSSPRMSSGCRPRLRQASR
jgi:hypothetical protein